MPLPKQTSLAAAFSVHWPVSADVAIIYSLEIFYKQKIIKILCINTSLNESSINEIHIKCIILNYIAR